MDFERANAIPVDPQNSTDAKKSHKKNRQNPAKKGQFHGDDFCTCDMTC